MKNFDWVTIFRKFNVYAVVVKPHRINFSRTLQLPTFIGELLVFMRQTFIDKQLARELQLG